MTGLALAKSANATLIRQALAADAPALREILYDTFESTWLPNITPLAAQAFRSEDRPAAYKANRGKEFWVAQRSGEVIGFVEWYGDFVNALHVRARCLRAGCGAGLMDQAEAEIARAGFTAARLETDTE